jgi:hypothetical protein
MSTEENIIDEIVPLEKVLGIDPRISMDDARLNCSLEYENGELLEGLHLHGLAKYVVHPILGWEASHKTIECSFLIARATDSSKKTKAVEAGKEFYGNFCVVKLDNALTLSAECLASDRIFDRLLKFLVNFSCGKSDKLRLSFTASRVNDLHNHAIITSFLLTSINSHIQLK